jgi:diguanylate cyclase (GGDEF)-like protein/PAS domain S-box-containing protein
VVEDSPADRRLVAAALVEAGFGPGSITVVASLDAARRALGEQAFTCVLLDLSLDDVDGLGAVTVISGTAPDVPIIVVSGRESEAAQLGAMAEGADEYLPKADLDPVRLRDLVERATHRRHGGRNGRAATSRAIEVLDSIDSPTATLDASGRIVAVNQAWATAAVLGGADPGGVGVGISYLAACDRAVGEHVEGAREVAAGIRQVLSGRTERFFADYRCPAPDHPHRWFSTRVTPLTLPGGGAVVTHLDITDLKAVERRLHRTEVGLARALGEAAPVFALIDAEGVVLHASDLAGAIAGLVPGQPALPALARVDGADRGDVDEAIAAARATPGERHAVMARVVDDAGRWHDLDLTVVDLLDDPTIAAVAVIGADLTHGRRTLVTSRLESRLLKQLPTSVVVLDDRGVIVYWNDMAAETYGYPAEQAIGRLAAELGLGPDDVATGEAIARAVGEAGRWEGDLEARRLDGGITPVHARIERISEPDIGFEGQVSAVIDITDRRLLEDELAYQALHHPLTGLPNRRLFMEKVDEALARSARTGARTAVIFVDLDDFKAINDSVGHLAADEILRSVGDLIQGVLRATDHVARFGGDEFVICCEEVTGTEEATAVVQRMVDAFSASPFRFDTATIAVTASVGVALSHPGVEAEAMVRDADAAMYAAKAAGKARVEVSADGGLGRSRRRRSITQDIDTALARGDVQAWFQPLIDLADGRLVGFEALARWVHPRRGPVAPDELVATAEAEGLVDRLTRSVLAQATAALATWRATAPGRDIHVAVNISPRQLAAVGLPHTVRAAAEEAGVPASAVCLELTESSLADSDVAVVTLRRLKDVGVELAIDDFGTGFSFLSHLSRFPLDHLKVDRTFIAGLPDRHEHRVIVDSVLGLAHALGLETVAEGIERADQRRLLTELGCDVGQGFLWSPAVPAAEALAMVRAEAARSASPA